MNFNPIVGKEDSPTVSEISQRPVEHRQAVVVFTDMAEELKCCSSKTEQSDHIF